MLQKDVVRLNFSLIPGPEETRYRKLRSIALWQKVRRGSTLCIVLASTWPQMVLLTKTWQLPCTSSQRQAHWAQESRKKRSPIMSNKKPNVPRPLTANSSKNNLNTRPKLSSCFSVRQIILKDPSITSRLRFCLNSFYTLLFSPLLALAHTLASYRCTLAPSQLNRALKVPKQRYISRKQRSTHSCLFSQKGHC